MVTSWDGVKLISLFEGFRCRKYLDVADKPTIGYGHLIKEGENLPDPISNVEALSLLQEDLRTAESGVLEHIHVPLQQYEFDALVSFTYNLGAGNLAESTLAKKLNARDYDGAAAEFPKWDRAGGKEVEGIKRRRLKEQEVFLGKGYQYAA